MGKNLWTREISGWDSMCGGTWLFKSHYVFPNHLSACSQSVCIVREDEQAVLIINPFERLSFDMELTGILPKTGIFKHIS